MKKVNPIPEGYHTITPYIMVKNLPEYITFLQKAFGAIEQSKTTSANGTVLNMELQVGTSKVMIAEARGGFEPMPMSFYMYVADVDATYERAVTNGATSLNEPANQFYGNRDCGVMDNKGNYWFIASRVEILSEEEITKRITPKINER